MGGGGDEEKPKDPTNDFLKSTTVEVILENGVLLKLLRPMQKHIKTWPDRNANSLWNKTCFKQVSRLFLSPFSHGKGKNVNFIILGVIFLLKLKPRINKP